MSNHEDSSNTYASKLLESGAALPHLAKQFLHKIPGRDYAVNQFKHAEHRLLSEFKHRLDRLEPTQPTHPTQEAEASASTQELSELLTDLLTQSQTQSQVQSQFGFFAAILKTLVPDQARILSALSDGHAYPLINIEAGTLLGWTHYALECVSTVGKNAGVLCPDFTYVYVQHLRQYGLIDIIPTENEQTMQYELLETDVIVRKTMEELKKNGKRARIVRQTLKISDFGQRFWAACHIED